MCAMERRYHGTGKMPFFATRNVAGIITVGLLGWRTYPVSR